jgi:hypothetical protein
MAKWSDVNARLFAAILVGSINPFGYWPEKAKDATLALLRDICESLGDLRGTTYDSSDLIRRWCEGKAKPHPSMVRDLGIAGTNFALIRRKDIVRDVDITGKSIPLLHWSALNLTCTAGYLPHLIDLRVASIVEDPPNSKADVDYIMWSFGQLGLLDVPDDAPQDMIDQAATLLKRAFYSKLWTPGFLDAWSSDSHRLSAIRHNASEIAEREVKSSPILAEAVHEARFYGRPFFRRSKIVRQHLGLWLRKTLSLS